MSGPHHSIRPTSAQPPCLTFVYGWPATLIAEGTRPDRGTQIISEAGDVVHQWSTLVPPEFAGIVIETLLFDWYAVAHVRRDDPQGHASPHIIYAETLWAREHSCANDMKWERAKRHP